MFVVQTCENEHAQQTADKGKKDKKKGGAGKGGGKVSYLPCMV